MLTLPTVIVLCSIMGSRVSSVEKVGVSFPQSRAHMGKRLSHAARSVNGADRGRASYRPPQVTEHCANVKPPHQAAFGPRARLERLSKGPAAKVAGSCRGRSRQSQHPSHHNEQTWQPCQIEAWSNNVHMVSVYVCSHFARSVIEGTDDATGTGSANRYATNEINRSEIGCFFAGFELSGGVERASCGRAGTTPTGNDERAASGRGAAFVPAAGVAFKSAARSAFGRAGNPAAFLRADAACVRGDAAARLRAVAAACRGS